MATFSTIRIKRSATQAAPSTLKTGELAYSSLDSSRALFIGVGNPIDSSGTAPRIAKIGGEYLTALQPDSTGVNQSLRFLIAGDSRDLDYLRLNNEFIVPTGTTAERPADVTGSIRFNTQDTTFEGYDGNVWSGLGGVKDVDQDTYIIAELTPGSDEDTLQFYTAGEKRLSITDSGQLVAASGYSPDSSQSLVTKIYTDNVKAGAPLDGAWDDGAYRFFNDDDRVTDVLDGLNEAINNVRNNAFCRDLTFITSPTAAGAGFTTTMTVTNDGTPNRYDIDWGDGTIDSAVTATNPTHQYIDPLSSPATVTVRAWHTDGVGTGSEATRTNTDYITIYTPDPDAQFTLHRQQPANFFALTGNDLYAIEGQDLWFNNLTTNTNVSDKNGPATVAYTIDWGDGTAIENITDNSGAGGALGTRLSHTWPAGSTTGTGKDTLTFSLVTHTTADPTLIPETATTQLKVYDPNIAAPQGLNTKTISFTGSVGDSPRLAVGFTDNSSGGGPVAGQSIDRVTQSSGNVETTITSSGIAHSGNSGVLTSVINNSIDGSVTFTTNNQNGSYNSLVVSDNVDYNLFNAAGQSTSFDTSIYYPGLYQGFKAKITKNATLLPTGLNSYVITHSQTGSTNELFFAKDDNTNVPTLTGGTLTENAAGTYKYISGIPHYTTGSSLNLSGLNIADFIGQTYQQTNSPFQVSSGTTVFGSGNAISDQYYRYDQIDGTSSFLSSGTPTINVGTSSPYALGSVSVSITSGSSTRSMQKIKARSRNPNGWGSYREMPENILVHTASQQGISEISIDVDNNLGFGFDDDGIRIFDFSSEVINTPSYTSSTNFYTNNVYSESADPGVQGTQEATLSFGVIQHDLIDYSGGYLPTGPNRSGDTGTQYFTFAFRRTVVPNFNINITSTTGVEGIFIAAPGTAIDNYSTLNGWLDCSIQANDGGVPGANLGAGGNGSNGCAKTGSDRIIANTALSGSYLMTLGEENLTNATGNVGLVRIALSANQKITSLSIS